MIIEVISEVRWLTTRNGRLCRQSSLQHDLYMLVQSWTSAHCRVLLVHYSPRRSSFNTRWRKRSTTEKERDQKMAQWWGEIAASSAASGINPAGSPSQPQDPSFTKLCSLELSAVMKETGTVQTAVEGTKPCRASRYQGLCHGASLGSFRLVGIWAEINYLW